nr:MAG TPA: hypothetical protein [Caudoviricetes sp.]
MTKEEYRNYLCKHCIRYNCKENICELDKDTYKVYKCTEYVSIFMCNKTNCRKCNKCNKTGE